MQVDKVMSGCNARSWDESDELAHILDSLESGEFDIDEE